MNKRSQNVPPLALCGALTLILGPCAIYLVWALLAHRWGHVALAATLNLALWTLGPLLLAHTARTLHVL